jgi:hypothetical protein
MTQQCVVWVAGSEGLQGAAGAAVGQGGEPERGAAGRVGPGRGAAWGVPPHTRRGLWRRATAQVTPAHRCAGLIRFRPFPPFPSWQHACALIVAGSGTSIFPVVDGLIRAISPRAASVPEAFSGYLMMTREDLFPAIARHWAQAVDGGELVPPPFASVTPAPLTLPDARAPPPEDSIPPTDPGPAILAHRRGGEQDPRKRPLSPYADADRDPSSSSRPHARTSGGSSGRGPGEEPGERGEGSHSTEPMARTNGRDAESQWMRVDGEPASDASLSGTARERPSQFELGELHELSKQFCLQGDRCPLLRDRRPCPSLHSVDMGRRHLSRWVRETALTLLRSHPFADLTLGKFEQPGARRLEVTWKEGISSLVVRWFHYPEAVETEAPPVPAPHPDAAPSGAPRGVKRKDLLELKGLVVRLCFRGNQCHLQCSEGVHGNSLVDQRVSPWVRDEATRLLHTHPYDHLLPRDYEARRCENVERVWRVGLIRLVDKWIEWYDSGERSAQGAEEGPRDTGGRAEGGGVGSAWGKRCSGCFSSRRDPQAPPQPKPRASSKSTITEETSSGQSGGREGSGQPAPQGKSGSDNDGPNRPALEELLGVVDRMCRSGDGCPSPRSCPYLHSADIKALEELPPWARETALTFIRAHPSAEFGPGVYDCFKWVKAETAWKEGFRRLVRRWVDKPELAEAEAPAVPAARPDAAPSGAPRGVSGDELFELKRFVEKLCFRGTKQCLRRTMGLCNAVHPEDLTPSQTSRWVRDELQRVAQSHPYQHLTSLAYERSRLEAVERAWKAGLIRQVDKWTEWHDSGEYPAQGLDGGPQATAAGAKGREGAGGVDGAPAPSPGARKRYRSPSADVADKSTTTESRTAQETSSRSSAGRREGPSQPALQGVSSRNSGGNTSEGPSRLALEKLLGWRRGPHVPLRRRLPLPPRSRPGPLLVAALGGHQGARGAVALGPRDGPYLPARTPLRRL